MVDKKIRKVIDWLDSAGNVVTISVRQEKVLNKIDQWPRSVHGEYCQVSRGEYKGVEWSHERIAELCTLPQSALRALSTLKQELVDEV